MPLEADESALSRSGPGQLGGGKWDRFNFGSGADKQEKTLLFFPERGFERAEAEWAEKQKGKFFSLSRLAPGGSRKKS